MRIVAIGDVGVVDGMMHIGDEAMFDALVEALRARGASSIVGVSGNPSETAERYGIEAVGRIGFTGARRRHGGPIRGRAAMRRRRTGASCRRPRLDV